jgi:hypothetical protein
MSLLAVMLWSCAAAPESAACALEATLESTQVRVTVDGALFTCYKFAPEQKYPYFWPVNGPKTGRSVTTETSEPYPHHHSLFFGCDRVNGGNYWQEGNERGQIVSVKPTIVTARGPVVVFEDRCRWRRPGAPEPLSDARRIEISAPSRDVRLVDVTITLTAEEDVRIVQTNHALFSARVVPALGAAKGGRLVNAEGALGEKGTFGVASAWCDYSGDNGGAREGIAILDSPGNRWAPCTWFTRDYGFFSPTPMQWLGADGFALPKGAKLTLAYRVVVHAGDENDADVAGIYRAWARGREPARK